MRIFNIVWKPSGRSCAFAVEQNDHEYGINYTKDTVIDLLSDTDTEGLEFQVWELFSLWFYEETYQLSYLKELTQLFPIKLQEYVVTEDCAARPNVPYRVEPFDDSGYQDWIRMVPQVIPPCSLG